MGRTTPSRGAPPAASRKDARAKRAKQTLNKDIPTVLQSSARAREGVESSELIVNPSFSKAKLTKLAREDQEGPEADPVTTVGRDTVRIRVQVADTFEAAACLLKSSEFKNVKSSRVAVLNMASPLRAGGGFLNGASAQEESLCMRSTLYPALKDHFYRLPEFGGVYTSDVLVFRPHLEGLPDLPKNERFFVDVVSSAMLRHPDIEVDEDGSKCYANEQDRRIAEKKMRSVMRMVRSKGIKRLVLGAWGCGAFGNPVKDVAMLWKKVLLGESQNHGEIAKGEAYNDMEIVFAIIEKPMAETFARHFGGVEVEELKNSDEAEEVDVEDEIDVKITDLESQILAAKSPILKERLIAILNKLNSERAD